MDTTSQEKYIYKMLLEGKSITSLDAMLHHGIGRLASRISSLVLDYGVPIIKINEPNTDGKGYHTRYCMSEADRNRLKDVILQDVHNH